MKGRKPLTTAEAEAMWQRFQRGETSLARERQRFGHGTSQRIRKALVALVGQEQYRAAVRATSRRGRLPLQPPPERRAWRSPVPPNPDEMSGPIVEVPTREPRLVLVQRIGKLIRVTTAERVTRTQSDALRLGGTVLIPVDCVVAVLAEVRKAARTRASNRGQATGP